MNKRDFPKIHFYDQDFVDIYDRTWAWVQDSWYPRESEIDDNSYFIYTKSEENYIDQLSSVFSSFFLVYSNRNFPAHHGLDYFYSKQEPSGAIRALYDLETGLPVPLENNPENLALPLFGWAEFNLFHKSANKKRIKEVMPVLQKHMDWLDTNFKQENGLYKSSLAATGMKNSPRNAAYYVDFNCAVAINALYISALGDILNDKELSFQYKRLYFSLKTRINSYMWDPETGFYYDIDENLGKVPVKTIAGFWPLLAEIPNEDKAARLISHLSNPETFGTEHPFPTLSRDHPLFSQEGNGYCGSVFPQYTFMVIKGLEKYQRYELARECAIRHLYFILDSMTPSGEHNKGNLWEAYKATKIGPAEGFPQEKDFPKKDLLSFAGLSTIALVIENIIGLSISLPRKTVDWIIPNLEVMGIENLSLKRNMITILSNKSNRGWEIHMESEKLYYFTINILDQKKKTLPIPSGKCSMLIDKL